MGELKFMYQSNILRKPTEYVQPYRGQYRPFKKGNLSYIYRVMFNRQKITWLHFWFGDPRQWLSENNYFYHACMQAKTYIGDQTPAPESLHLNFRPVNILLRPSCHISINSERNLYNRYTRKTSSTKMIQCQIWSEPQKMPNLFQLVFKVDAKCKLT